MHLITMRHTHAYTHALKHARSLAHKHTHTHTHNNPMQAHLSMGNQHGDSLMCLCVPDPGYTACFLPPPFLRPPPLSLSFPLPSPVPYPTRTVCNAAIEYPVTRCVCNTLSSPKRRMRMQGLSVRHSLLCLYSVCCVSSRRPRRGAYPIHP